MSGPPLRPLAVAFDIIGTVFPLEPLRPSLIGLGLPPSGLEAWFATALRDAFALAAANDFKPFAEVLSDGLDTVLAEQGLRASEADHKALTKAFQQLPPRPDAEAAFTRLAAANIPVLAVSNGARSTTKALLKGGGLEKLVAHIVSTEQVKRSKPAKKVYLKAAKAAGVDPRNLALVAAHPWDIHGAHAAGLVTGYLGAPGAPYPAVMHKPDVEGSGLVKVVDALLALKDA